MDHRALVGFLVDRALLPGVAHELPARVAGRGGDTLVVVADAGVDRQRGAQAEALIQLVEAPEADAHAVFVP